MPEIATPTLLKDPGFLFWAPLGSADPTHVASASKFTDTWPVAWIPLGATQEGSTFSAEQTIEAIRVAELFDPVAYDVTEMSAKIAFALTSWTLVNFRRAMNGGSLAIVSGVAGPTAVTKYEPPEPSEITRAMLGWESLDGTARLIAPQVLNGGTLEAAFKKSPDKALIPFEFNFERPLDRKSFAIYAAGDARVGV